MTMNIESAQALRVGDRVRYPADRGEAQGTGVVTHIARKVYRNICDIEFMWITVAYDHARQRSIWPSNRLERIW